jgi:hypothetical protein
MLPMFSVTRIAFGVSFGLLALGAMAVVAIGLERRRRYALLSLRKSAKQAVRRNIHVLAPFERQNRIKRPPFLPHPGGSSLRN